MPEIKTILVLAQHPELAEAIRTGDERNYARVEERLKPFKESVETHQKNIEALRREIANQSR